MSPSIASTETDDMAGITHGPSRSVELFTYSLSPVSNLHNPGRFFRLVYKKAALFAACCLLPLSVCCPHV